MSTRRKVTPPGLSGSTHSFQYWPMSQYERSQVSEQFRHELRCDQITEWVDESSTGRDAGLNVQLNIWPREPHATATVA